MGRRDHTAFNEPLASDRDGGSAIPVVLLLDTLPRLTGRVPPYIVLRKDKCL
jgi:hypothetical protein